MTSLRKKHTAEEKAKIALEALNGQYTQAQLSSKYNVHVTQINSWKKQLKEGLVDVFRDRRKRDEQDKEVLINALYQQIGQLTIELEWSKKKSDLFK